MKPKVSVSYLIHECLRPLNDQHDQNYMNCPQNVLAIKMAFSSTMLKCPKCEIFSAVKYIYNI